MADLSGLRFAPSHEWLRIEEEGVAVVGITDHAAEALGDVVFVELPEEGRAVRAGEEFSLVESVKAASDIYSPVSGVVIGVNAALEERPELINESPFEEGWIARIRIEDPAELEKLLDEAAYRAGLEA